MKILSYNLYCVKDTEYPIPVWEERQKNITRILNELLSDSEVMVACFQEVTEDNLVELVKTLHKNNFVYVDDYPMITAKGVQYNIVAIRNTEDIELSFDFCIPHGHDESYKFIEEQVIHYGMSDYRTTVFVNVNYKGKDYLIGNIHTDYISTVGKTNGVIKSLSHMDTIVADYKVLIGDMNMVAHMSEAYNVLEINKNYTTISRSETFTNGDNSWHGYGTMEEVNVDFAFILKDSERLYKYDIVKQSNVFKEGSDHRPILLTIAD